MALKKSRLYSSLWQSCDELRGGMDASQYKDYILTLLFMKYVSDKSVSDTNFLIDVPKGGSFTDMVKLKGDKEIGDKINKIIGKLAQANDLKGVIDEADFNDEDKLGRGKEMQDRLSKLVAIFDGLDFQANRAEGDDLLGDAYEYLMHGHPTADLWRGNSLASPYFKNNDGSLKTFDFAVANPPFSLKAWTSGFSPENDEFRRFQYGVPPAKNGDYAFLLHVIASLKSKGKAAVILPHGVLFRGNKEADIRRNLITRGLIKGIIGLPPNLFYGTGIPACIVVIDKENAHARTGIFMVDASKGFQKDGNKNRLRSQDIHKIVDVFNHQIEQPRYSRMVSVSEIADPSNDYNLNIPRYIDSSEPEDLHDLEAHLRGGIPNRDIDALQEYWDVFPSLRKALFKRGDRAGYSEARIEAQQVKPTILAHEEFAAYQQRVTAIFDQWRAAHSKRLHKLKIDDLPRQVIHELSEDLLKRFADVPLLSRYDVYQRLMDYWAEVMQDDVYMIAADGWLEAARPRGVIDDKEKKIKETPDLVVGKKKYKMDLIPPPLIVARYFADEQAEIDALQANQDEATQALEEYTEEHAVEEGLLEEALNDKGKVSKGGVNDRMRQLTMENGQWIAEDREEGVALKSCLELMEAESDAKKAVKEAQEKLDAAVLKKYGELSEAEIKTLAVDDKWFATIQVDIEGEVNRITQRLADRVKELNERYSVTLSELDAELESLSKQVDGHLSKMGLVFA
jgi:type I restriction enzyme M protein